jgi:uncharacterized protein with PQ loop repeat
MKTHSIFKGAKFENHKSTLFQFVIKLIAHLSPFALGVILACILNKWKGWSPFYSGGEFYIYAVALIGSSCYTFFSFKKKNTDRFSVFFALSSLIGFLSALLYAILIVSKAEFSQDILKPTSISILIYSFLMYYYAKYTEETQKVDISAVERSEIDGLKDQL